MYLRVSLVGKSAKEHGSIKEFLRPKIFRLSAVTGSLSVTTKDETELKLPLQDVIAFYVDDESCREE